MKKKAIIMFLLIAAVFPAAAQKQALPIVAVLDLSGEGLSESETNAITNLLISSIFETDLVAVIDRNQREQILSEIAFSLSGCTDDSCAIEIGKMLAADLMVIGAIDMLGSRLSIDLKAMDVESARIKGTYNKLFESVDDLVNSMEAVGGQFVQNFTGQLASKKAVLKYEELVPLFISCDVDGADVYIDGDAIGKIVDGVLTKAVNINAEINLKVKADGYYDHSEMVIMDTEKSVNVVLEVIDENWFAFKAQFGGGMMGSLYLTIFPIPNWWFVDIGVGFSITNQNPGLINFPVAVKSGAFIGYDDRSFIRPYVGGALIYSAAVLYNSDYFYFNELDLFEFNIDFGPYGGAEFKLHEHLRLYADLSVIINALWQGSENLFQFGIGIKYI